MPQNIFDTFVASAEADVNIDIDVNETESEGDATPEAPMDVSETPEASELELADTATDIEAADETGDNVEDAVSSLESLYEVLSLTASTESCMSDSTIALVGLHLDMIGSKLGTTGASLVPSLESDNYFERNDVVASMEAIMDRIKEGTAAIGGTVRKMYEGVKQYVKDMSVAHTRAKRQYDVAAGYLAESPLAEGGVTVWKRTAKRLAQGQEIGDVQSIAKGAQDLLKLATQVLTDRKGVQVYANAAQMLAKDGAIDEERISGELRKAYPVLKVTGEDGNAPLMIGNTAVFLEQGGKGEAGGIVRLGFKNNTVEVTGQRGFKESVASGIATGKAGAKAVLDSKAGKVLGKVNKAAGAVQGALGGGAVGAGLGMVGGPVGAGIGAAAGGALGTVAGAGIGALGNKMGRGMTKGAGFVGGAAAGAAGHAARTATGTAAIAVSPLTQQQAKGFMDLAAKLIEVVAAYETNVEARSATNEQIAKLVDEATTAAPAEEGQAVDKGTLKENAKTRRALAKSWKKTLKSETKVASWALNTANALTSYVTAALGEAAPEAEEAPEGAAGGEE